MTAQVLPGVQLHLAVPQHWQGCPRCSYLALQKCRKLIKTAFNVSKSLKGGQRGWRRCYSASASPRMVVIASALEDLKDSYDVVIVGAGIQNVF
jgi:hypothetical protein